MPLPIPNLDDRTFEQLVAEGLSLIPRYSPEWTDHNVADPGRTLIELLSYVTEAAIFQLNELPPEALEQFLELGGSPRRGAEPIDTAIVRALDALRADPRALTVEEVAAAAVTAGARAKPQVKRAEADVVLDPICRGARAVASREETAPARTGRIDTLGERADVLLVSVDSRRSRETSPAARPRARQARLWADRAETLLVSLVAPGSSGGFTAQDVVHRDVKERVPLGTPVHVVRAAEVTVSVQVAVARKPVTTLTAADVEAAIRTFLDPVAGGFTGGGWPFGRWVFRSELFQLLEALPAVDHVESLELRAPRRPSLEHDEGIEIPPGALVASASTVAARVSA